MNNYKFICGLCNKAFTKHSSLKRHKTNQHLGIVYNCINCNKQYKRREDLSRHAKKCLEQADLNDQENRPGPSREVEAIPPQQPTSITTPSQNEPSQDITNVYMDLTVSDSEEEPDIPPNKGKMLENDLLCSRMSRETNTTLSGLHTANKATNTDPLIILTPDEVTEFQDGLTIATFQKCLNIFIDTMNSDIVQSKARLSRPGTPSTQIGLLNCMAAFNKGTQADQDSINEQANRGNQTTNPVPPPTNPPVLDSIESTSNEEITTGSQISDLPRENNTTKPIPGTSKSADSIEGKPTPMEILTSLFTLKNEAKPTAPPPQITTRIVAEVSTNPEDPLMESCTRKPTRPSLFVPPCKRAKLNLPKGKSD